MFNSALMNVVIGLVFIYLLYSLLTTTINEIIASTFSLRAKKLKVAITRMLDDDEIRYTLWGFIADFGIGIYEKFKKLLKFFSFKKPDNNNHIQSLSESFYKHPGIKYLGETQISNKPSYISNEFFSKILIDILKETPGYPDLKKTSGDQDLKEKQWVTGESPKSRLPDDTPVKQIQSGIKTFIQGPETQKFIQSLLTDANNDLEKFKVSLELWFDETMKRTTGWYKRQCQRITFCIGLILAILFNVDTISIVNKLSNDPKAAEALADIAANYAESHKDSSKNLKPDKQSSADLLFESAKKQVNEDIKNANSVISLGWAIPSYSEQLLQVKGSSGAKKISDNSIILESKKDSIDCKNCLTKIIKQKLSVKDVSGQHKITRFGKLRYLLCMTFFSGLRKLLGYIITALAISLGAPFWFDLLSKFIQLRYTGKKPDDTAVLKTSDSEKPSVQRVG